MDRAWTGHGQDTVLRSLFTADEDTNDTSILMKTGNLQNVVKLIRNQGESG